jgi:hypothetical protein
MELTASSLNQKLILAIERQAELEDQLAQAKQQIRHLEEQQRETNERLTAGLLISKSEAESETQALRRTIETEQASRTSAEAARSRIEKELEDLTRSLFEEANKLVVSARKETQAVLDRNEKLSQQLQEKDVLLASHQQQLEELKAVLQRISNEEDKSGSRPGSPRPTNPTRQHAARHSRDLSFGKLQGSPLTPHFSSVPASPQVQQQQNEKGLLPSALDDVPAEAEDTANTNGYESNFQQTEDSNLVLPTYRTDTTAFYDFKALLPKCSTPKRSMERPVSGNASPLPSPVQPSSSYWGRTADEKKDKDLQSSKFWKRALIEDIEPTLRLDQAPDLGYLGRRTFLQAVSEGHLVVEAQPTNLARYQPERQACALCGDARNDAEHARKFRCRTSEAREAAVHPLCDWCLDRVRAVCGYVAFLRQVRDGLWKGEEEAGALMRCWAECVKLRETMFWTRVGHMISY